MSSNLSPGHHHQAGRRVTKLEIVGSTGTTAQVPNTDPVNTTKSGEVGENYSMGHDFVGPTLSPGYDAYHDHGIEWNRIDARSSCSSLLPAQH